MASRRTTPTTTSSCGCARRRRARNKTRTMVDARPRRGAAARTSRTPRSSQTASTTPTTATRCVVNIDEQHRRQRVHRRALHAVGQRGNGVPRTAARVGRPWPRTPRADAAVALRRPRPDRLSVSNQMTPAARERLRERAIDDGIFYSSCPASLPTTRDHHLDRDRQLLLVPGHRLDVGRDALLNNGTCRFLRQQGLHGRDLRDQRREPLEQRRDRCTATGTSSAASSSRATAPWTSDRRVTAAGHRQPGVRRQRVQGRQELRHGRHGPEHLARDQGLSAALRPIRSR